MENKYRLLDMGEDYRDGNEILTVSNGWQRISGCGTVQAHTVPMRRPDDGKGKYILIGRPNVVEMGDYTDTSFWKWGVGWLLAGKQSIFADAVIWRKPREVAQIVCPAPRFYPDTDHRFVVLCPDGRAIIPQGFQESEFENACREARQLSEIEAKHNVEYQVAKVVRTFKCIVDVVEKEVGK